MKGLMLRKAGILLLVLAIFSLGLMACGADQGAGDRNNPAVSEGNQADPAAKDQGNQSTPDRIDENGKEADAFPVTVKDGTGTEVTLTKAPERVISLIPSNTEIIYALGYGDKVVGVTSNDNYPEEVTKIAKVGDMNIDVEKVLSLKPDLVLANQYHAKGQVDQVAKMREAGLTVLVVNDPASLEQVYESIAFIAKVTGTAQKGEEIIRQMKARYQAVADKAKRIPEEKKKKVWVEISAPPELYTTGKGTFMDELLKAAGAINVAGKQEGWPKWTEEDAVSSKPEVILLTYNYIPDAIEAVKKRPAWKEVPAVKNGQIYMINGDLVARSGPRLMDGLEEIAKKVYPDVFQ